MKKVLVSLALALGVLLAFVVPTSADPHYSGQVDVDGNDTMDYYYSLIVDTVFMYQDSFGNRVPKFKATFQNITYLKNLTDVIPSGYERWMQPNKCWLAGNLYDAFQPVENLAYTWSFSLYGR